MVQHLKSRAAKNGSNSAFPLDVPGIVRGVIDYIRTTGDKAVRSYSEKFDKWSPASFKLSQSDIDSIVAKVPAQVITDIKTVQDNLRTFALAQRDSLREFQLEIRPGVFLGQKNIPIDRVGAYIPGGRYPLLASAHMTILTAKAAGVPKVIACTPPINGQIPPSTVAAAYHAGADEIWILGGVQAVAAMAIGTETMDKVDFIAHVHPKRSLIAFQRAFGNFRQTFPIQPPSN